MPTTEPAYSRREYKMPPIVEAVCEFQFGGELGEWNPASPGLMYAQLRERYSAAPQAVVQAGVEIQPQPDNASIILSQKGAGVIFADADDRHAVIASGANLIVRVRQPYPGWEDFAARVADAAAVYVDTVADKPVSRIGLRYVNRVRIPGESVDLPVYFSSAPTTPDGFPEGLVGVFARFESRYDLPDRDVRLVYTFTTIPAEDDGGSPFILDLDVIELFEKPLPLLQATQGLLDLKARENEAFESILTDATRELFDAGSTD